MDRFLSKKKRSDSDDDRINVYRQNRSILFFHAINGESVSEFFKLLTEIEKDKSTKPIEIIINSEGGHIYDGLAMYDRIRQSEHTVHTKGTGTISSMALIVFLAGDYRSCTTNTTFMNHQGTDDSEGKVSDLEISLKENKRLEDLCVSIISEHTSQPLNKIKKEIRLGDRYFDSQLALDEGYVHEVVPNKKIIRKRRKRT